MKNSFLNFSCRKCKGAALVWTRQPTTSFHAYRVTCRYCGRFAGWGTEPQHQQLLMSRTAIETVSSTEEPYPSVEGRLV
jgi:hypothetical protein